MASVESLPLPMAPEADIEEQATTTAESNDNMNGNASLKSETTPSSTPKPKPKRPNYHQLHARPLPLSVYPIPAFIPHNPLSLLRVAYLVLRDWIAPPSSHSTTYSGYFSAATQSVHVTDPATVRALWEMGFFGTGTLSRSEPNWLSMERRRLGLVAFMTAEEVTAARRKVRTEFKRERARLEREVLEEQKRKEAAVTIELPNELASDPLGGDTVEASTDTNTAANTEEPRTQRYDSKAPEETTPHSVKPKEKHGSAHDPVEEEQDHEALESVEPLEPINQEHLQLSLPEAFYLSYALGALKIVDPAAKMIIDDNYALLQLLRQKSYFPPAPKSQLELDDPFLLSYVVYHHFRSLGWVVRDGVKFAVDYLLYERGPVFTHATFAIVIVPSYTAPYWYSNPERAKEVEKKMARKSWHWLHCVNRVQGNVVKTLVLAYVDVPAPIEGELERSEQDIGRLLLRYKVREFALRRWSANRNRD